MQEEVLLNWINILEVGGGAAGVDEELVGGKRCWWKRYRVPEEWLVVWMKLGGWRRCWWHGEKTGG